MGPISNKEYISEWMGRWTNQIARKTHVRRSLPWKLIKMNGKIFALFVVFIAFATASVPAKEVSAGSWCPTCVSFVAQTISQLENIIANVGIIGGCAKVCSYLPNQVEATVCNLLCDIVGIEAFVKLIEAADPDPIWICEEMTVCSTNANAAANITSLTVAPEKGPRGSTFNILASYQVTNTIATGTLEVLVLPPASSPMGEGYLLVDQTPNTYNDRFTLKTQPSEQQPFNPGEYKVEVAVCEGSCGSTHSNTKTLSVAKTSFTLTQ